MSKLREAVSGIRNFWAEVIEETRRCEWPVKDELMESTMVVLVFVFFLAAFVYLGDLVLVEIAKRLFKG